MGHEYPSAIAPEYSTAAASILHRPRRQLVIAVCKWAQWPLHIGLSRTDPHLTNNNVIKQEAIATGGNNQFRSVRAGRTWTQSNAADAVDISNSTLFLAVQSHLHFHARLRSPPYRNLGICLQNHVNAEHTR